MLNRFFDELNENKNVNKFDFFILKLFTCKKGILTFILNIFLYLYLLFLTLLTIKLKFNKFIFILVLTLSFFKISAGYHAGNITYSWLYGYTYQIKLTTFTGIGSALLIDSCEDTLCFGDGTGVVVLRSNGPCGGSCSPACDGVVLPGATIKMNEYITTHTYPGPGNYMICFTEQNRNAGVNNIPNSVNQPMSFYSFLAIPTFGSSKNNSSIFANHPITSGCMNNGCFTYNPSATDVDGDSLSYEIFPCLNPGASIPVSGTGGTFSINPVSGTLSWCNPQYPGDYNVIIKITEWRKDDDEFYYIVGYVERDTELSVSTCTGINDLKESNNTISIFPNPTHGNISITLNQNNTELLTIELIDVMGRQIKTFTHNEAVSKQQTITLNLENIYSGIYFLKITGSNTTSIIKKIIKQ